MKSNVLARSCALVSLGVLVFSTTISCGGSDGSASNGNSVAGSPAPTSPAAVGALTVAVKWPQQRATAAAGPHLIPDDSQSIALELTTQAGSPVASTCLVRLIGGAGGSTSSYTFTNVPTGALQLTANAYADQACSETPAQATGAVAVSVQPGVSQSVTVTMNGTVTSVTVSSPTTTAYIGGSPVTLTASALDSAGETVLTAPGDWTWSCSPTGVVTPSGGRGPTASLTGMLLGQTVCTFTVAQAAGATPVQGTGTVFVQPAPTPTPSPSPTPVGVPSPAASYTLTTLASFSIGGPNGCNPVCTLTSDGNGGYYGTNGGAGADFYGTIFRYSALAGVSATVTFGYTDGSYPQCGLTPDGHGNYYGTTELGGANNLGVVFKLGATTGYSVLASLTAASGEHPLGTVVVDGTGNVYGTASQGGAYGYGTIFECAPSGGLSAVYSFNPANQGLTTPFGGLTPTGNGSYYGTCDSSGDDANGGGLFLFTPGTGVAVLANFAAGTGGSSGPIGPECNVVSDGQGNVYGTTTFGGTQGNGTLFRYSATSGVTVLQGFTGPNGTAPFGSLSVDPYGNVFGTTGDGGSGPGGTVFVYSPTTGFRTLWSFGPGGGPLDPAGGVIEDGSGNLFGTTSAGGVNNQGSIYELSPSATGAVRQRLRTFPTLVPSGNAKGSVH